MSFHQILKTKIKPAVRPKILSIPRYKIVFILVLISVSIISILKFLLCYKEMILEWYLE